MKSFISFILLISISINLNSCFDEDVEFETLEIEPCLEVKQLNETSNVPIVIGKSQKAIYRVTNECTSIFKILEIETSDLNGILGIKNLYKNQEITTDGIHFEIEFYPDLIRGKTIAFTIYTNVETVRFYLYGKRF